MRKTISPAALCASRRWTPGYRHGPDADLTRQREVADAFLAASRGGDFDALVTVLDPDVVLRADIGALPPGASREVCGAPAVAEHAPIFSGRAGLAQPALVNAAGCRAGL